ncbi:g4573 [Coccomyxa elongata]
MATLAITTEQSLSETSIQPSLHGIESQRQGALPPTPVQQLPTAASPQGWKRQLHAARAFGITHYLPLAFVVALIWALAWPEPGKVVGSWQVKDVRIVQALNNFFVFLVSGLTLSTKEIKTAFKQWPGLIYGLVTILAFTPCLGFGAKRLNLTPPEFNIGLAIFCVVPTALGVGVALTAAARGNQALALLLTVATNLLGIVTVPYELKLILLGSSVVSVDPSNLGTVGRRKAALRCNFQTTVGRHKATLSMFSHTNLALIIWQTLSGARNVLVAQPFHRVALIILASIVMHLIYLAFNAIVIGVFRFPVKEGIAVLIMASQKSAPIAVTVISYITPDIAQQGLFSVPAIVGQLAQIFMGSLLIRYLSRLVKQDPD